MGADSGCEYGTNTVAFQHFTTPYVLLYKEKFLHLLLYEQAVGAFFP